MDKEKAPQDEGFWLSAAVERRACCSDVLYALSCLEGSDGRALGAQHLDREMDKELLETMDRLHTRRVEGDADHAPVDPREEASRVKTNGPDARLLAEDEGPGTRRHLSGGFFEVCFESDGLFQGEALAGPLGTMRLDPLKHRGCLAEVATIGVTAAEKDVFDIRRLRAEPAKDFREIPVVVAVHGGIARGSVAKNTDI